MSTDIELDDDTIEKLDIYIRKVAKKLKDDAGYSGAHHDGGSSRLLSEWKCYLAGRNHTPFPIETHMATFLKATDEEYSKYLHLKEKFEK